MAGTAQAQTDQAQLVRPLGAADLNSNLARLSANPRDVDALIGAGEAALALDDPRAAAGFFARADTITSGNGRIKVGLARVNLKLQNPAEAVRLFDQAGRLGFADATILVDRGLARDMTGDQAGAQRDYQAALQRTPNDAELIRRYAASLGISGQVAAAERALEPLLYKSDRAAWRYRAFILAMNNQQAEARKVADQTMPAQLAAAIVPYMQKMPYLTAPQKAAAVHFGQFPAQTGTRIAAITPTPPAPGTPQVVVPAAPVTVAAAPTSRPQSARARRAEQQRQRREAARLARAETPARVAMARAQAQRQAVPAVQPTPTPTPTPMVQPTPTPTPMVQPTPAPPSTPMVQPTPSPALAQTAPAAVAPSVQASAPTPDPTPPPVRQASAPATVVQGPPAPGFESVASVAPPPQTAPQPAMVQSVPAAPPQPDPAATRTLADIIRAIDVPEAERQARVAAVDLEEIAALQAARRAERQAAADKVKKAALAKAKAEADAKAKKEAEEKKKLADNPSRNWLQIGIGASQSGLAFTLNALRKKYDSLSAQDGWSANWGQTNRLLVGPFPNFARAKALEDKVKAAGGDAFAWKSSAGEVVERLGGQ